MPLIFSNLYKLDVICDVGITGPFNTSWTKSYVAIPSGKATSTKPDGVGSGLKICPLKLKPGIELAGHQNSIADLVPMANLNHLIYLVVSTRYPMFYVGVTEGGLRSGIFDTGRLIHHARKMLAIRESSTSHTGGWLTHAMERYDANLAAHTLRVNDQDFLQDLLGDVYIAVGHQGHDAWTPASVEDTVLSQVETKLNSDGRVVQKMNTAGSGRDPVDIELPDNFDRIIQESIARE